MMISLATAWGTAAQAQTASLPEHVKGVTAISEVFGDGRKVKTVVLEYDAPIRAKGLDRETFTVAGKEIVGVSVDGRDVILQLKAETDLDAQPKQPTAQDEAKKQERDKMMGGPGLKAGWSTGGDDTYTDSISIVQKKVIRTAKGAKYAPSGVPFTSTKDRCRVADDFRQEAFKSPYTGQILPYNLFIPEGYDPSQQYPLVLFIHDAGVASSVVQAPLWQGNGAVVWASPEAQAKHPCIVVAPEFPVIAVDDDWNYSHHLDAVIELLKDLQTHYSIDPDRIYTTGQSMGCMSSIVMMLKEPDLFAGALLVAGKWNPELMGPLAGQNIWIISCEGDRSSTELQGQAVALWRENGAQVNEATWNMEASPEEFAEDVAAMLSPDCHLMFTHLTGGSHRGTWMVAYGIEGVRDWLLSQRRR